MATLQQRNGSFRVLFYWHGKKESFTLGQVPPAEADAKASQVDYLLMRLKQGLLTLPEGIDVTTFVQFDGKPPMTPPSEEATQPGRPAAATVPSEVTIGELRKQYVDAHSESLEASSLATIDIHFGHLGRILGEERPLNPIGLGDLQRYVKERSKAKGLNGRLSPETIRKEIASFRVAWNWAIPMGYVAAAFPNRGLRFPKGTEKPPFMTYEEITRRIDGTNDELWDCLYLQVTEIVDLLTHVKAKKAQPFVYPMTCFAAHTGARRSEIIRAKISDVDFDSGHVTIHERKRNQSKVTTRRVPLSPFLTKVLKDWLAVHPGGPYLFCQLARVERSRKRQRLVAPLSRNEFHDHFERAMKGSKWEVLKGAHALRHSFISALASKGVDQRMIDEFVGHQSEEQRRRYRHLYPNVKREALASVFG